MPATESNIEHLDKLKAKADAADRLAAAVALLVGWPNCLIDKPLEHYISNAKAALKEYPQ